MDKSFFAMLMRLKYINRWSLMWNTNAENVMEHSFQVAMLAHALYVIREERFPEALPKLDLGELLCQALYHDASEIITGDMPTPIKYQTVELREAYAVVEQKATERLLSMLPEELREAYAPSLLSDDERGGMTHKLVKAADCLCAYIKCVEEQSRGNNEFKLALEQTKSKLDSFELPELAYFCEHFLPAFSYSLDELQGYNRAAQ